MSTIPFQAELLTWVLTERGTAQRSLVLMENTKMLVLLFDHVC